MEFTAPPGSEQENQVSGHHMSSTITVKEKHFSKLYLFLQPVTILPTESRPRNLISKLTIPNSLYSRINRFGKWPVELSSSVCHSGEFTLLHNCNDI